MPGDGTHGIAGKDIMAAGRNRRWSASALLVLLLSTLFVGVPAAHAAFSSRAQSGFSASTLVLATPAVTYTPQQPCAAPGGSGKYRLNIGVSSVGSVDRATGYALIVTDPNGVTYSRSVSAGFSSQSAIAGIWTYYVEAQYQVPGTSNVWKSKPTKPVPVPCQ